MKKIAKEKNLGLISIDVSNLSAEDFTGMPIANTSGEEITTTFSEPSLYNLIMKEYNSLINKFKMPDRKYNIILLFDEISRTKPAVFNAMRKVFLEKEFSEDFKLPEDIMMTGALNPAGIGTTELTSHTRDVLDIISSTAKFTDVIDYATTTDIMVKKNSELGFEASKVVGNIISKIAHEFETSERPDNGEPLNSEEAPFWWTVNGETFYISGREFTESIANIVSQMRSRLLDMNYDKDANYTEEDYNKFIQEALNVTAAKFGETLKTVVIKMKVTNFIPTLIGKIVNNPTYKAMFNVMKERKTSDEMPLDELFRKMNKDVNLLSKKVLGTYFSYIGSPTEFGQDLGRTINVINENMNSASDIMILLNLYNKENYIEEQILLRIKK